MIHLNSYLREKHGFLSKEGLLATFYYTNSYEHEHIDDFLQNMGDVEHSGPKLSLAPLRDWNCSAHYFPSFTYVTNDKEKARRKVDQFKEETKKKYLADGMSLTDFDNISEEYGKLLRKCSVDAYASDHTQPTLPLYSNFDIGNGAKLLHPVVIWFHDFARLLLVRYDGMPSAEKEREPLSISPYLIPEPVF